MLPSYHPPPLGRRRSATSSCLTRWVMLPSYHPPTRAEAQCYFELPDEVRAASKLVSQSSDLIRLVGDCRQLPPLG